MTQTIPYFVGPKLSKPGITVSLWIGFSRFSNFLKFTDLLGLLQVMNQLRLLLFELDTLQPKVNWSVVFYIHPQWTSNLTKTVMSLLEYWQQLHFVDLFLQ